MIKPLVAAVLLLEVSFWEYRAVDRADGDDNDIGASGRRVNMLGA